MRTWYDLSEMLLQTVAASASEGRAVQIARVAVKDGVQLLSTETDWKYKLGHFNFATSAKYTTGTVEYDHTGGTYERQLTLTSGTWPAWAQNGTVLISSVPYEVESRISDTVLTLKDTSNPGADVASGTSYSMYRQSYTLPADCMSVTAMQRMADWNPTYVQPADLHQMLITQEYTGQPRHWSVLADPASPNQKAIWFYPAPDSAEAYQVLFRRRSSDLRIFNTTTGTVSASAGGSVVTGVGTSFNANMVGGVLRFGDASNVPNSLEAQENQYVEEAEILAVDSATSLRLTGAVSNTFSGVKFRISSKIQFDDGPMLYAAQCASRMRFTNLMNQSAEQSRGAYAAYQQAKMAAAREDGCQNDTPTGSRLDRWAAYDYAMEVPQLS